MTAPDGIERRSTDSVAVLAERLDNHLAECAEQNRAVLHELRSFRSDVEPLVRVWQAGGVAVGVVKLIALLATSIAAVWAVLKLKA